MNDRSYGAACELVSTPQGSRGLSLFYAEVSRDQEGRLKGIEVQKLKDKLGTRQMPTAELLLDGLQAHRVSYTSPHIIIYYSDNNQWMVSLSHGGMSACATAKQHLNFVRRQVQLICFHQISKYGWKMIYCGIIHYLVVKNMLYFSNLNSLCYIHSFQRKEEGWPP